MSDRSPAAIEVVLAPAGQEPVFANLLELYSHDFSEFMDLELGPDGRFEYPDLPNFWKEADRFPFLVKVGGHLAGFALVWKGSRVSGDPEVWDLAEFFIARGFRRRGIGAAVAREIWRRFPGAWELRVRDRNQGAVAFWHAAVRAFATHVGHVIVERDDTQWHVLSFTSPAADG